MKTILSALAHARIAAVLLVPSVHAFTAEQWLGLPASPTVITLQRAGIAKRAPNTSTTLTTANVSPLAIALDSEFAERSHLLSPALTHSPFQAVTMLCSGSLPALLVFKSNASHGITNRRRRSNGRNLPANNRLL